MFEAVHLDQLCTSKRTGQRGRAYSVVRKTWLTLFLPTVAFAYLAFCYIAATRLVPVRVWRVDRPEKHLYAIKAGVTTINIIVVAISLFPLKTLLDDIKSEEFFRALHESDSGVPLRAINGVSIPSNSFFQSVQVALKKQTSKYYAGAIMSGIAAALISSLAPAALSVGLRSADGDVEAIRVGAIVIDSAYSFGSGVVGTVVSEAFKYRAGEAATLGWVQNILGAKMTFTPTSPRYGVPVPLDIDPTARARYLTDVVIMDPVCNWTVPDVPPTVEDPLNLYDSNAVFTLSKFGITIKQPQSKIRSIWQKRKAVGVTGDSQLNLDYILNSTTLNPDTSGTMAWIITQCTSCTGPNFNLDQSTLDLLELPTKVYEFKINGTNGATPYAARYSILLCNPQISIETRQVFLDGTGKIDVLESTGLTRQGNLHFLQTKLMLGNGLMKYATNSGPESEFDDMGRAAQIEMLFGSNLGSPTTNQVLRPQPVEKITEQYQMAQQAALRSFLSGAFGTAYVPGRVQVTKLVFTSSLPHIVVSTILFALVSLFINLCYLRPDTERFTLFSVATVLTRSNAGAICEDAKYAPRTQKDGISEYAPLEEVEDRLVYLTSDSGPGPSLYIE